VIGGPKKTLKTSILLDMAISLATGSPFLGHFPVPDPVRVAVYSGEGGRSNLQETARRICAAKDISLEICDILWSFQLPRLTVPDDLNVLHRQLREAQAEVVFLDPLYLCLLGTGQTVSTYNLSEVGPILSRFADCCLEAGTTPVIVHHATKTGSKRSGLLDLDDLAFVGIGEFARQWVLLNRREDYQMGSGEHSLTMAVGGSAGHSGAWQVDVCEGVLGKRLESRDWKVDVKDNRPGRANCPRKKPVKMGVSSVPRDRPVAISMNGRAAKA
jgi:replicative DNA helicase